MKNQPKKQPKNSNFRVLVTTLFALIVVIFAGLTFTPNTAMAQWNGRYGGGYNHGGYNNNYNNYGNYGHDGGYYGGHDGYRGNCCQSYSYPVYYPTYSYYYPSSYSYYYPSYSYSPGFYFTGGYGFYW